MTVQIAPTYKPPTKGFTAWSFSRWRGYSTCPLQAKLSHLDKLPQPESPHMARGSNIHDLAAEYIAGKREQLPDALKMFRDVFNDLRDRFENEEAVVEDSWAFRRDWSITNWNDWDGCWLRVKVDAARLIGNDLDVLDWKTGKYSPQYSVEEYMLQIELYSLGALLVFGDAVPDLTVSPRLVFLDHGIVHPEAPLKYTLADLPRLKAEWSRRVAPMMADRAFVPNPGRQCQWCAYSASKNGPCVY